MLTVTSPAGFASASVNVAVCTAPGAPGSPSIEDAGGGPLTGSSVLSLSWAPPSSGPTPTRYEYRINGGPYTSTTVTKATAPARGNNDPIQLFVRAFSCSPELGPGPESASPVYALAAPVADFSMPTSAPVNTPVVITDISSPQATSWLWLFDDGTPPGTSQSQVHTFTTLGAHTVTLIASNGSGSSQKTKSITITGALPPSGPSSSTFHRLEPSSQAPERRGLGVTTDRKRKVTLSLLSLDDTDLVVYLRLSKSDELVVERRLTVPPADGVESLFDVSAFVPTGSYTLELVTSQRYVAALLEESVR